MTDLLLLIIAILLPICGYLLHSLWRARQRHRALVSLLDSADALEGVLHQARQRMTAMRAVVDRVAPDIGAEAQASLDAEGPVQQGLRNVLEHRLWIAKHAETASLRQLQDAVAALQRSQQQIAARLDQLESAGAELAAAAQAVEAQEAREPPALRRQLH